MRIADMFSARKHDEDAQAEIQSHLEHEIAANMQQGMSAEEARRRAIVSFGGVQQTKESVHELHWTSFFERTVQDLRFGMRILLKTPVTTGLMLLIFALGIGGTTAFFSVVHAVLLRPLPYPHPEQIMRVVESWHGLRGGVAPANWHDWREQTKTMSQLAAVQPMAFNLGLTDVPERIGGARVTSDFFHVFNLPPVLGRTFTNEEDQPGKDDVVVISNSFWKTHFGANANALGTTIRIDDRAYRVIGVMPAQFDPLADESAVWLPAAFNAEILKRRDSHYLWCVGRLKPGVTLAAARSEMDVIAKRLEQAYPRDDAQRGIQVLSLKQMLVEDYRPTLLLMLAAAVFLLLIACANIANLQLARSAARQREIALRAALGASPARIVRQLLAESTGLALAGGVLGIAVAYAATRWLVQRMPGGAPRLADAHLDAVTLGFSLLVTIACGLVCGLVPAARSRSVFLTRAMNETSGNAAGRSHRDWVRASIVVAQTALTLMLLAGAALLLKSADRLNRMDPGFDPANTMAARIPLSGAEYSDPDKIRRTFEAIVEEVKRLPGVQAVALDSRVPLAGGNDNGLLPEGKPLEDASIVSARFQMVTPDIFAALHVPVRAGRSFTADDRKGAPKVMIINEALARAAFPGQNPIGKRISCCEDTPDGGMVWKEVVGVVGDMRSQGLDQDVKPEFYLPVEQVPDDAWRWIRSSMDLVVRGTTDPTQLTGDIRHIVARVAPGTPLSSVMTMQERISQSVEQSRFTTMLLAIFAGVALLLASVGMYGVLSYSVAQRNREIGIRMAIGAQRSDVLKIVVMQGMTLTAAGMTLGLVGAVFTTRLIANLLFQVSPGDPIALLSVAALLAMVALLASYIPARRASGVDPLIALRAE